MRARTASLPGKPSATDRKSTRLNSSHGYISYAVFCLKKKNKTQFHPPDIIGDATAAQHAHDFAEEVDRTHDAHFAAAQVQRGSLLKDGADDSATSTHQPTQTASNADRANSLY